MVIFGDSHIALYADVPGVRTTHIGPILMHRMGRDGLERCGVNSAAARPGETIGLICGEIDVRVHIAKQRELGRYVDEIIGDLVSRYFEAVATFRVYADGAPVAIFSVIPPAAISYPSFDPAYPRNGTDQERVLWTLLLNAKLEAAADEAGYVFVDQHSAFADTDGLLGLAFSPDGVHIDKRHAAVVDLSRCFDRIDVLKAA